MKNLLVYTAAVIVILLSVAGCPLNNGPAAVTGPVTVTGVTLNKASTTILE